jgi:hypothetical protein
MIKVAQRARLPVHKAKRLKICRVQRNAPVCSARLKAVGVARTWLHHMQIALLVPASALHHVAKALALPITRSAPLEVGHAAACAALRDQQAAVCADHMPS